jgi:hypothetical protein
MELPSSKTARRRRRAILHRIDHERYLPVVSRSGIACTLLCFVEYVK